MNQQKTDSASRSVVMKGVLMTVIANGTWATLLYLYFPWTLPPMSTVADRLAYTLRWNALSVGFVTVLIAHIGNLRFTSSQINPLSSVDKDRVGVHCRVLQNSLEQFIISFVLQLATTTWLSESQMRVIPIIVLLFLVGRILFWKGYLDPAFGHTKRSYGLPPSMFPSIAMLLYCSYKLCF